MRSKKNPVFFVGKAETTRSQDGREGTATPARNAVGSKYQKDYARP